jgi:hypothetical protein
MVISVLVAVDRISYVKYVSTSCFTYAAILHVPPLGRTRYIPCSNNTSVSFSM